MKRFLAIFILPSAFCLLPCFGQVPITNNTMITTWADSRGRAQFGQRQNFFLGEHYILKYPQFLVDFRDHSRSGQSNLTMDTNQIPMMGPPEWGATHGQTNVLDFFFVSGNDAPNSNTVYGLFSDLVQAPTSLYNRFGLLTNDWTQSTSLFKKVFVGDIAYHTDDGGGTSVRDANYGARTVALANGILFVDSWSNTLQSTTNSFAIDPNGYWFDPPFFNHSGNELQLIWALTTLTYPTNAGGLGEDTNIYTAVIDFTTATISSTNHCTITSLSKSGNNLSFTFHADRMAPGFYVPDGVQTNDCRGAFTLMPPLGNAFCEILRVQNLPTGNYKIVLDDSNVVTTTSAQLSAGFNWFTNYTGAFWAQKKEGLGLLCDLLDVSRATVSDDAHPGDNRLIEKYESYATAVWPTNNTGVDGYISQSDMVARESELQAEDVLIHAAAQQTNHTFSILQLPSVLAPAHR